MASVAISNKPFVKTKSINKKTFALTTIKEPKGSVSINEVLPFRVRFTNIGIPSYTPATGAPIGIAVIGLNNYIL